MKKIVLSIGFLFAGLTAFSQTTFTPSVGIEVLEVKKDTIPAHLIITDRWGQKPTTKVQTYHIHGYYVTPGFKKGDPAGTHVYLDFLKKPIVDSVIVVGHVLKIK